MATKSNIMQMAWIRIQLRSTSLHLSGLLTILLCGTMYNLKHLFFFNIFRITFVIDVLKLQKDRHDRGFREDGRPQHTQGSL